MYLIVLITTQTVYVQV